jgi:hypothetical protein
MEGSLKGMIYKLPIKAIPQIKLACVAVNLGLSSYEVGNQSLKTWGNKLGHLHDDMILRIMAKEQIVDGLRILNKDSQCNFCEGCVLHTMHKWSFPIKEI